MYSKKVIKTEKWWLYNEDGTRTLDLESFNSACTLGFSNEEVIDAISAQMKKVSRIVPYLMETNDDLEKCNNFLLSSGGGWAKLNWTTSGTSAVECAILMCDEYWTSLGKNKTKIISYSPTWHGTTYLARGLNNLKEDSVKTSRTINIKTPSWFKLNERESEELRCLNETEMHLKQGGVGGVIFNPVAWFNGFSPFSNNFWVELRKLCDKYDSLMIVDDVMSCWGKMGSWYSYETFEGNVKPDIIAIGKSMTSGLVPIGATMCSKKISEKINHMMYGHTWCPYMGAVGAINKTIEIIQRDNLLNKASVIQKNNEEMCELLGDKIKSYRAIGCFLAIDLHNDISQEKYISKGLSTKYREKVIKITSPLIANEEYHSELKKKLNFILRG